MAARPGPNRAPAVLLRGAEAAYNGTRALADINLRIDPGEFCGVVGPSGAGKTTLLRLLTGRLPSAGGTVEVFGQAVRAGRVPPRIGYVPQVDAVDWDFPLRVEDAVLLGLASDSRRIPWFSRGERRHARGVLARLGLEGLERRQICELSGGQQQRMFLARALVRRCDLLLLDEPTAGVDLATRADVLRLLGELNATGLTVLLTTHDLNWVGAHLPRIAGLSGTIVGDGPPADVLVPEVLADLYGADVRVIYHGGVLAVTDPAPLLGGQREQAHPEQTEQLARVGSPEQTEQVAQVGSPEQTEQVAQVGSPEQTEQVAQVGSPEQTERRTPAPLAR